MTTDSWDMPTSSAHLFPKSDGDRLENEENYYVWSIRMKNAFESCEMMGVVDGQETMPPNETATKAAHNIWKKKDNMAKAMITQCVKSDLVIKVAHAKSAKDSWDTFSSEFSQTGSGSIMLWFRRLTRQLPSGGDVSAHVTGFQEAIRYLANAEFQIPSYIAAAILLSTLPSDPQDPQSWNQHVAGVKIDKKATTLSSVVNGILEEKRRLTEDDKSDAQKTENALTALEHAANKRGKLFCRNCKREGHTTEDCRSRGGAKYKEKQGKSKQRSKRKEKGKGKEKEKAHNTNDDGGGGSDDSSGDESTHHVRFEKCFMTSAVDFSDYISCESSSPTPSISTSSKAGDLAYSARTKSSPPIVIDSGTSSHIHSVRNDFKTFNPSSSGNISGFGNGNSSIAGRGEVHLHAKLPKGGKSHLKLKRTCYVPNSTPTLLSVSRLDEAECYTLFGDGRCVTFENRDHGKLLHDALSKEQVIFTGTKASDRLYYLDTPRRSTETSNFAKRSPISKLEQLHQVLGHLNYDSIRSSYRKGMIRGVKLTKKELEFIPPLCAACAKGKATRASFPKSKSGRAKNMLDLVHSDLWGPAPVQTIHGTRYAMTFTDDSSSWVWVYYLKRKSDAFAAFKEWLVIVEAETGRRLLVWRTDGGGEFIIREWEQFLKDRGIRHEKSSPNTPEQNGDAERQNRSLFDRARTVLIDARLPLFLWAEAVNYIAYTKNRNPTRALTNTTPFEVRYAIKPDVSKLYPFGCKAYVYLDAKKRNKLEGRATEGIFVGYADTQKAFRIYIPSKRTIAVTVHVRFDEQTAGGEMFQAEGEDQFQYNSLKSNLRESLDDILEHSSTRKPSAPEPAIPQAPPQDPPARQPRQRRPPPPPREPSSRAPKVTEVGRLEYDRIAAQNAKRDARAAQRAAQQAANNSVPFPTGEAGADAGGVPDENEGDQANADETANITAGDEPKTHRQAMNSPDRAEWEAAEQYELDQIQRLGTFKLVPLPRDRKAIGSKWVYKIKRDADGNITTYRARLVAQGFTQKPGVDFLETYAPVAKIESIRLLLALAATLDWEIHVIDVDSAFLNSDMPEDQTAYLKQPPGHEAKGKEDWVWFLSKALYGLRQSGHLWYQKLKGILVKIGFKPCKADPCVFVRIRGNAISIISSHVDDLGMYCNSKAEVTLVKSEIRKYVSIKDLGEISTILGIEVIRNRSARTISLSHRRYIDEIVKEYGQESAKSVSSPIAMEARLTTADSPKTPAELADMRNVPYQNAVGSLNHAAVMTRPDISKAVQTVAQFSSNPGRKHWSAVTRIIRYLKHTRDWVLTLGGKQSHVNVIGYCDADYANSPDHGRSISGYAMMFGSGCFSWSAKKQTATALSTGEAEYYATTHAGREVLWLRQLLTEIGFGPSQGTTLRIDNTSSIRMIDTPDQVSNRTKHIKVNYHWIREEVAERGTIVPEYIPSSQNISDIFTKGFHAPKHKELSRMLGMVPRTDAR